MTKTKIKIDVVSDVVCPWCYIGKRRLEKAIEHLKEDYEVEVEYHPFELNSTIPKEGYNQKQYLSQKFGSEEKYEEITASVSELAAEEGIEFDFDRQTIAPNTREAHRLLWLARQKGKQLEAVEAFFKAYFTDGIDLSNRQNLEDIAVSAGLDRAEVKEFINSTAGLTEVQAEEIFHQKIGINGVPFYIVNNRYTISGAQPTDVFIEALPDIAEKSLQGQSCETGKC